MVKASEEKKAVYIVSEQSKSLQIREKNSTVFFKY